MRILHFIPSLHQGGAERQIALHANALTARGHEIVIALLREGVMRSRIGPGIPIEHLGGAGNYDPRLILSVHRMIQRIQPDVVQSWLPQMDVLVGLATRIRRVPWLLNERSSSMKYKGHPQYRLRVMLARHADAIVSNSVEGLRYWDEAGVEAPIRRLIPNIVQMPPESTVAKGERPLIAYVGRLIEEKNVGTLVRALAAVPEAEMILCGVGPLGAELRQEALAHGVADRITFAGFVEDIASILRRADALALLSDFEGQPNAVLEAMVCGCPVIVSDIPSHREILDESSAIFVKGHDVDGVARAMAAVVRDVEAARERAARAKERSAAYASDRVAAAYERVYRELVERRA